VCEYSHCGNNNKIKNKKIKIEKVLKIEPRPNGAYQGYHIHR
jgi:ribosomal protein L20A (L18A)